jgi:uncharacterized protein (TIGR00297 family)
MFLFTSVNIIAFSIIVIATFFLEFCIKKSWLSIFNARKILHISAIVSCAYAIQYSHHLISLSYIFLFFSILLLVIIKKKVLLAQTGTSYGIALFPLSFFVLLQMSLLPSSIIVFAVLTLGIADAMAGLIGFHFAKQKIKFLQEEKSVLGFFSFFITTTILYIALFPQTQYNFLLIPVVAFVPALSELFSYKGSDNFTTPIITAIWVFCIQEQYVLPNDFPLMGSIILSILAFAAYQKKWLNVSGTTAALFVGVYISVLTNWRYLIPLALFLGSGSLASKLNQHTKEKNGRDAVQVFANGFVALICISFFAISKNKIFELAYFTSIAISMSDTMSSEIGKYFKQKTYNIIGFHKMEIGLSGGISIAGTTAGLFASLILATCCYFIFTLSFLQTTSITTVGFVGMLVDSVLGSLFQAKYKDSSNCLTESKTDQLIKGYSWCTNDLVNVISNIITILLFVLLNFL